MIFGGVRRHRNLSEVNKKSYTGLIFWVLRSYNIFSSKYTTKLSESAELQPHQW